MIRTDSPEWGKIKQHAEEQIARLRRQNDDTTLNAEETSLLRARIRAWKEILALPEKSRAPQTEADPPDY